MSDQIVSSRGGSLFFGVCFITLAFCHVGFMIWKRTWMMLWLIIGLILEITGYFSSGGGHGVQTAQVIIAPIFLAASVYISFGGLMKRLQSPSPFIVSHGFQSFLFVVGDIVSFGLQIAGIVLQLVLDNSGVGTGMIIGGFALQIVSFCCFVTLTFVSQRRLKTVNFPQGFHTWKSYITALYVIIVLFFIRNIFRLVEYAQGWNGYIFRHAAFAYVFDSTTMLLVCLILLVVHPGFIYEKIEQSAVLDSKELRTHI